MKTSEAIEILEAHNKWRRGDDNYEMADPAVLGKAINHAIEHMRRFQWQPIETYDYENFPLVILAGFITPSEYAQSNGSKPFWEISIGRCWHVNTKKFTGFLGQQPTHWMPLPDAPESEG